MGGGIIGLSLALRARQLGMSVAVLERGSIGRGASHVAAGMLAPVAEAEFGHAASALLALSLRSAAQWPRFAAELLELGEIDVGLTRSGTLMLARDEDEALELQRQLDFRRSLGLGVERLRAGQAREREPALAPTVRLALEAPDDHSVDPRLVIRALALACERAGVSLLENAEVARVELDSRGARVTGVTLADGRQIATCELVAAAGAWSPELRGLPAGETVPVRPVKGQILRLRDPAGAGMATRVLRFQGGYLVPRGDGRYVLGATVEERGYEAVPTAGGVHQLLRDAHELIPGVSELEIEELSVGLRPGTPDNVPVIGRAGIEGLIWASGHHRNGVLLAPVTARIVCDLLAGEPAAQASAARPGAIGVLAAACSPERFRTQHAAPSCPVAGALS